MSFIQTRQNLDVARCLHSIIKENSRPIRYASQAFYSVESRWDTVHQELLATKWALDNCLPYVLGRRIKVVTDHANLQWLKSIKPTQSKLARWCLAMEEDDFYIEDKPCVKHVVPARHIN